MNKITIGPKRMIYISFGLFGNIPFYNTSKGEVESYSWTVGGGNDIKNLKDNEIKTATGLYFGAIANFGIDMPIKKEKLSIELRLQPGLTKIMANPSLKNYSALLSVAYTFGKSNAIIQFNTD